MHSLHLELGRIRLTPTGLVETEDDGAPAVSLAHADIRSIHLAHGTTAERPFLLLAFGALLIAVALFMAVALVRALAGAISIRWKWGAAVSMIVPGVWAVRRATRQGLYLDVELVGDRRKLAFGAGVTRAEAEELMAELGRHPRWERLVR
jgi:hypothetical protein